MKYVILRTRFFRADQTEIVERRDVLDDVYDCESVAGEHIYHLECEPNEDGSTVYWLAPGECREPSYEVLPITA
jgi:hypothetical protein